MRDLKRARKVAEGAERKRLKGQIEALERRLDAAARAKEEHDRREGGFTDVLGDGSLKIRVTKEGKGFKPPMWATVEVHLVGKVGGREGEEFHSSQGGYPLKVLSLIQPPFFYSLSFSHSLILSLSLSLPPLLARHRPPTAHGGGARAGDGGKQVVRARAGARAAGAHPPPPPPLLLALPVSLL